MRPDRLLYLLRLYNARDGAPFYGPFRGDDLHQSIVTAQRRRSVHTNSYLLQYLFFASQQVLCENGGRSTGSGSGRAG